MDVVALSRVSSHGVRVKYVVIVELPFLHLTFIMPF